MQQKHFLAFVVVGIILGFLVGQAIGAGGAPFNPAAPNHPINQLTLSDGVTPLDADEDGIIDAAQSVIVSVSTSSFAGSGQADCGTGTAISGGCDCQTKNITQNTPQLNGNQPKGWLCACEGGADGEASVVCTN